VKDKNSKIRTEDNGYHRSNLAWYTIDGMVSEKRGEKERVGREKGREG